MCGISAVLALDGTKTSTYQVQTSDYRSKLSSALDESLEYIKHRGPDAQGKWISDDNRVAFGHVRLAINDLSTGGEQPFANPERTVFAVVNGEFYDHEAIKANLPEPYHFKGNSDCEIVIALYLQYGIYFLSKLRGEFAICLYDSRSQLFIAARDRYGIKPLYWSIQDGRLLVAAEMKAFLPFGWEPEWDVNSLMEDGWAQDDRMIFKNVRKVRPGHYIVCKGFSNLEQRQYWDLDFPDKHNVDIRSEKDIIQGLHDRLFESVRLRLKADVPVGVYLSGGIDSSAIAGMMAHLLEEEGKRVGLDSKKAKSNLLAFTVEFEGAEFNEAPLAQKTADFLGIRLEKVLMNEESYARLFEEAYWHSEHHMCDLNAVGKYALSELARSNGFKVVLTGEGSDEHFGGYSHYLPDFLLEADDTWPASKRDDAARLAMLEHAERNAQSPLKGSNAARNKESILVRRMLNKTAIADLLFVPRGDFASWTECLKPVTTQETIANNLDGRILELMNTRWHPLHTAEYIGAKGPLQSFILACLGDKSEMAHSIEGRPPFLDHVLTEYVNNIPPALKIKRDQETGEFTEKWILREAMKPYILEELYKRKKHPFSAPINFPDNGPLRKLLDKLITEENIEKLGFVDWESSKDLTAAAFGPKKDQLAMRKAFVVAQWVSLGQRFGVKKAVPPNDF